MKIFLICLIIFIFLTGCTDNKKEITDNNNQEQEQNIVQEKTVEEIVLEKTNDEVMPENKDTYAEAYFNNAYSLTNEYVESNDETVKDKIINLGINIVDFIFYEKEINGVKFNDLTEETKNKIKEIAIKIDNKIMEKYPHYKEDIKTTTTTVASDLSIKMNEIANDVDNYLSKKIGEDKYNEIKKDVTDVGNGVVDTVKDISDVVVEKTKETWKTLKDWYEKNTDK